MGHPVQRKLRDAAFLSVHEFPSSDPIEAFLVFFSTAARSEQLHTVVVQFVGLYGIYGLAAAICVNDYLPKHQYIRMEVLVEAVLQGPITTVILPFLTPLDCATSLPDILLRGG